MAERILLVEDEEKLARMVELELQYEGYEVEKAFDGRAGLDRALSGEFDLVLLDIMLPIMDGWTVLKKIREESAAPVIMLTAGPLTMDTDRHEVSVNGEGVELTRREFDLLRYLLENKERVISRESLLDHVWGFDFVGETNAVDVYIRFLRAKIDEHFGIKLIHTVRGVGYVIREEGQ